MALAFTLFARQKVDAAVVEVGLGGSLDATNVLHSKVAVLTSVGLDHTELLGDTVELIARDKAGIIKPGQTVVSGVAPPSAQAIIAARCAAQGATLWQLGRDFHLRATGRDLPRGPAGPVLRGPEPVPAGRLPAGQRRLRRGRRPRLYRRPAATTWFARACGAP